MESKERKESKIDFSFSFNSLNGVRSSFDFLFNYSIQSVKIRGRPTANQENYFQSLDYRRKKKKT